MMQQSNFAEAASMSLTIEIQRTDGFTGSYRIDDVQDAQQWLTAIDVRRLFNRPNLVIADAACISLIATNTISWLTVRSDLAQARQIGDTAVQGYTSQSEALYGRAAYLAELEDARLRWASEGVGDGFEALGELLFPGGLEYYVKINGRKLAVVEQRSLINNFFDFPVFASNDPAGGFTLLNPNTLSRARFHTSRKLAGLPPHTIYASAQDD